MTGRVTLVGGGPGRADLLTVAAVRALGAADVVLYDRLAPYEALAEFAPTAELVDVGKRPGHHAIPQHEIEALLVEHALAGRHVVRLKGGDPYVLGRGGEEVLACHRGRRPRRGHPRRHERRLRARRRRHPAHPPRAQPPVHRRVGPRPAHGDGARAPRRASAAPSSCSWA